MPWVNNVGELLDFISNNKIRRHTEIAMADMSPIFVLELEDCDEYFKQYLRPSYFEISLCGLQGS